MNLRKHGYRRLIWILTVMQLWGILFSFPLKTSAEAAPSSESTELYIRQALASEETDIDLSDFHLSTQEALSCYQKILQDDPFLFYVSRHVSYTYAHDGRLLTLYPQYTVQGDQLKEARDLIVREIHQIISLVDPAASEWEKALLLHDLLATDYTYSPKGKENYDIYGFLTEKHGVCQAFSMAYIALGRAMGLEVDMVISEAMDHAWNHVKVSGNYYHVDVTRDLPEDDGSVSHERWLLSDEQLSSYGYSAYTCRDMHLCASVLDTDGDGQQKLTDLLLINKSSRSSALADILRERLLRAELAGES